MNLYLRFYSFSFLFELRSLGNGRNVIMMMTSRADIGIMGRNIILLL
jgi:hypothetical protein